MSVKVPCDPAARRTLIEGFFIDMTISNHAKQRLIERYDFKTNEHFSAIIGLFFHRPHYRTIKINENGTCIRQIRYKEKDIQAVINPIKNVIITILPNFIIWQEDFKGYDFLCEKFREVLKFMNVLKGKQPIIKKQKYKKYIQIGKWFVGKEK